MAAELCDPHWLAQAHDSVQGEVKEPGQKPQNPSSNFLEVFLLVPHSCAIFVVGSLSFGGWNAIEAETDMDTEVQNALLIPCTSVVCREKRWALVF